MGFNFIYLLPTKYGLGNIAVNCSATIHLLGRRALLAIPGMSLLYLSIHCISNLRNHCKESDVAWHNIVMSSASICCCALRDSWF